MSLPDGSELSWRVLRLLRSDPPGSAAKDGHRRREFGAGLEQGQELWEASATVGPEVSPIILFYGLTQAARSLSAAHVKGGDWEAPSSHGLVLEKPDLRLNATPDIAKVIVRDKGRGFVQQIAELLDSPTIPKDTTLAALVASLPEHDDLMLDELADPGPLAIGGGMNNYRRQDANPDVSLVIGPLPDHLIRKEPQGDLIHMISPSVEEVQRWLSTYPRLAHLGTPTGIDYVNPGESTGDYRVQARWSADGPLDRIARMRWCADRLDVAEPAYMGGIPDSGWVLPRMPGNDAALHPLITWWIVLFSLSMLARYYPRFWIKLLDADRCQWAVPIAAVLTAGQVAVPRLLVEELVRDDLEMASA